MYDQSRVTLLNIYNFLSDIKHFNNGTLDKIYNERK